MSCERIQGELDADCCTQHEQVSALFQQELNAQLCQTRMPVFLVFQHVLAFYPALVSERASKLHPIPWRSC